MARTLTADAPPRTELEFFIASLAGTPTGVAPPGLDLTLTLELGEGFAFALDLAPGLELAIAAEGSASAAARVRLQPPAVIDVVPPPSGTQVQGEVTVSLARVPAPDETAVVLLGAVGGSRLEAQRISLGTKGQFAWDPVAGSARRRHRHRGAHRGRAAGRSRSRRPTASSARSWAASAWRRTFDFGFGWTAGGGIYFTGSGGLEVQVPTHIELGPVEIQAVTMRIGMEGARFPTDLTADIKAALGPLTAVVERIGAAGHRCLPRGTAAISARRTSRFLQAAHGRRPRLDAGVVKGGGYLFIDPDRGEYAGALELVFAEFLAVRAIGLITTRNPDGSPGFSLVDHHERRVRHRHPARLRLHAARGRRPSRAEPHDEPCRR